MDNKNIEEIEEIKKLQESKDKMLERGRITLNGFEFIVKPIFLGEEEYYLNDIKISPIPVKEDDAEEVTDKEMSQHLIAIFSSKVNVPKSAKLYELILKKFSKKYFYADKPMWGLVKWLQKKVFFENKSVLFYDLERKFNLSKSDIEKIIIEIHKISGF